MPTSVDVKNLKINKLTEAQYDTAVQGGVIGENELSVITDLTDEIQVETMPTASASNEGQIVQYIGATDSTYTNAYFYKCVSDGQSPATYSWTQVEVQPAGSSLPDQTGQSGKFLTTNGTNASWGTTITGQEFNISRTYTDLIFNRNDLGPSCILLLARRKDSKSIAFYHYSSSDNLQIAINGSRYYNFELNSFYANANTADLGTSNYKWVKGYITKLNNGADINVPAVGGKLALQIDTMPTAASSYEGVIYQFTGTTDSTYTNGRFYKCVSDGQPTPTYSWEEVSMGGSSLPSQTGNAGKFLTTDGTDASWGNALQNLATTNYSLVATGGIFSAGESRQTTYGYEASSEYYGAAYGYQAVAKKSGQAFGANAVAYDSSYDNPSLAVGKNARAGTSETKVQLATAVGSNTFATSYACAIGAGAEVFAKYSMQLGKGTNSEQGTLCFGTFYNNNWYNYKLLNSDGTIPKERLVNAVSKPSTMPELTVAGWSNNTQTVTVTGVTATNTVFVSPAPASASDYAAAGIICTAQSANSLTFTCTTVPTNAITVNVVIMG